MEITPFTSAVADDGTWIFTCMIGSSSTGAQFGMPSLMAMRAAVWNAASEESTVWNEPSVSATATSTTGKAQRTLMQVIDHALFDRRNEVSRHHAAGDLVLERKARHRAAAA